MSKKNCDTCNFFRFFFIYAKSLEQTARGGETPPPPPGAPNLFNHSYRFRFCLFLQKCLFLLGDKLPRPYCERSVASSQESFVHVHTKIKQRHDLTQHSPHAFSSLTFQKISEIDEKLIRKKR